MADPPATVDREETFCWASSDVCNKSLKSIYLSSRIAALTDC